MAVEVVTLPFRRVTKIGASRCSSLVGPTLAPAKTATTKTRVHTAAVPQEAAQKASRPSSKTSLRRCVSLEGMAYRAADAHLSTLIFGMTDTRRLVRTHAVYERSTSPHENTVSFASGDGSRADGLARERCTNEPRRCAYTLRASARGATPPQTRRSPATVTVTSRRTAAFDGTSLAAVRARRQ